MKRRDFMQLVGKASAAAAVFAILPVSGRTEPVDHGNLPAAEKRYRIHGSKKLGCSGFDFPDDPAIIENGLFMPRM